MVLLHSPCWLSLRIVLPQLLQYWNYRHVPPPLTFSSFTHYKVDRFLVPTSFPTCPNMSKLNKQAERMSQHTCLNIHSHFSFWYFSSPIKPVQTCKRSCFSSFYIVCVSVSPLLCFIYWHKPVKIRAQDKTRSWPILSSNGDI